MYLSGKSEKCISDIQQKLYHWNAHPDHFEKIIQTLIKQKFIDEERYALYFVRDKFRFNKWGKIKIRMHLFQKKIPEALIQKALDQIQEEEYLEMLKNVILSKRKLIKDRDSYTLKNKLLRHAASKGFEPDSILKTLENIKI